MAEPLAAGETARLEKLARNLGREGASAPEWVKDNVLYWRAFKKGLDQRRSRGGYDDVEPLGPGSKQRQARPSRRASRAGRALNRAGSTRPGAYLGRGFSPSAAARRVPGVSAAARAGDAGGLLLALVLYPLALATVKYGPAGPAIWFRAKWLNQPTGTLEKSGTGGKRPRVPAPRSHAPSPAPPTGRRPGVPQ